MASECAGNVKIGLPNRHDAGGVQTAAPSTLHKVRRVCGILSLLLTASLLITSVALALNHSHQGPIAYSGTAAAIALLFALVFFTHTRLLALCVALGAVLIDAAVWAAAYSVTPVGRDKFNDCMTRERASGSIPDDGEYYQYYDSAADPFFEGGPASDPDINQCMKHVPSLKTVIGLFGFAFFFGCILALYLVIVLAVLAARRRCSTSQHQGHAGELPLKEAAIVGGAAEERLNNNTPAMAAVVVPLPATKV